MHRPHLSATLNLFLLHLCASFLSAALILGVVYFTTMRLLESQTAAVVQSELRGLVEEYSDGGQYALRQSIARRTATKEDAAAVYLYASPTGAPLSGNLSHWPEIPLDGRWRTIELIRTDIDQRVLVGGRAFQLPGGARLFVGRDLREQRQFREVLSGASMALLLFFLLFGTLGGFVISRRVLKRVDAIAATAGAIAEGNFALRAPISGSDDEFDRLAGTLNDMLSRNETLIGELRAVTDSLAHDLRTPLTRLRSTIEEASNAVADGKHDVIRHLEKALAEADYINSVFAALIDISRAEAGLARDQFEPVDLAVLLHDAADFYRPLAEEKDQCIQMNSTEPAMIVGHTQFLSRAIANIFDNAIKFSPRGATVIASIIHTADAVTISICDQGPGVSDEEWPTAIMRFGRVDSERPLPGAGLGLSLVATVARMHGAELLHSSNDPGLCISIRFQVPSAKNAVSEIPGPVTIFDPD